MRIEKSTDSAGIAKTVDESLRSQWSSLRATIDQFLARIEAPMEDDTRAIILMAKATRDPKAYVDHLATELAKEGEHAFLTLRGDKRAEAFVLAIPAQNFTPKNVHLVPFLEIHSRLVAWWLVTAWRSAELAGSAWLLGDQYKVIAASTCVRALLETSAAFWCDARKLAELWTAIKQRGGNRSRWLTIGTSLDSGYRRLSTAANSTTELQT